MKKVKILLVLFVVLCWSYRLYKINGIIAHEGLADFKVYYDAARTIMVGHPDVKLILKSTYGPPIVLLGFLPFATVPFLIAEYLITGISLLCFGVVIYLFWREYQAIRNSGYLILIGLLAFSFPLIFSLGMGNPLGIVTLGIYSVFLIRNDVVRSLLFVYGGILKLFPFVLAPVLLVRHRKVDTRTMWGGVLVGLVVAVLSVMLLPRAVWPAYSRFSHTLYVTLSQEYSTNKYNQGFASTMARAGSFIPSFSSGYYLFVFILAAEVGWVLYRKIKNSLVLDALDLGVLLVCFVLLVHPFPWQHYYAVLLPFLVYKVASKKLLYLLPLLLISLDHGILNSSQFLGTLALFSLIFVHALRERPSI